MEEGGGRKSTFIEEGEKDLSYCLVAKEGAKGQEQCHVTIK